MCRWLLEVVVLVELEDLLETESHLVAVVGQDFQVDVGQVEAYQDLVAVVG